LVALVPAAFTLLAGFALEVEVFATVAFLADLDLVTEAVDLAETGAGARGDAEVFEDIAVRVGSAREVRNKSQSGIGGGAAKSESLGTAIRFSFLTRLVM
jgi:hypothetical protein